MELKNIVADALKEDMPSGDLTTAGLGLSDIFGRARLIAKEDLVLSGTKIFSKTFETLDPNVKLDWKFKDGDFLYAQQAACILTGDVTKMLSAERVALNFLGRLSGIATLTKCFVRQTEGTKTQILDTRKTTPLLRDLEKEAVRHGGGMNHRRDLSSAVLIKENHLSLFGDPAEAIRRARKFAPEALIVVEVRTIEELQKVIGERPNRVLLDNMNNDLVKEALTIVPAHIETEVSGNMNLDRIPTLAALGVDYISVGALTHSAPCADFSLLMDPKK